jgi:hypothetical protein
LKFANANLIDKVVFLLACCNGASWRRNLAPNAYFYVTICYAISSQFHLLDRQAQVEVLFPGGFAGRSEAAAAC